jgi:hypothetical protein
LIVNDPVYIFLFPQNITSIFGRVDDVRAGIRRDGEGRDEVRPELLPQVQVELQLRAKKETRLLPTSTSRCKKMS